MATIVFYFNGNFIHIQCGLTDCIRVQIQTFLSKVAKNKEDVIFLYNGSELKVESFNRTFNQVANESDRDRRQMNVLVDEQQNELKNEDPIIKSKYIICPQCKENIRIIIKDFKINLYQCKNGHTFDNMSFQDFAKTQLINESTIKCDKCERTKSDSYKKKFYICFTCKQKLCCLCQNNHNDTHYIVDYNKKDYICPTHCDSYTHYCNNCKLNICAICENEHKQHDIISFGSIIPNIKDLEKEINNSKLIIDKLKEKIQEIISKLFDTIENIDNFFKIYNDIIKNYDIRCKNFSIIQNVNDISKYNNIIIENINKIINDNNIKTQIDKIMDLIQKHKEVQMSNNQPQKTLNNNQMNMMEQQDNSLKIIFISMKTNGEQPSVRTISCNYYDTVSKVINKYKMISGDYGKIFIFNEKGIGRDCGYSANTVFQSSNKIYVYPSVICLHFRRTKFIDPIDIRCLTDEKISDIIFKYRCIVEDFSNMKFTIFYCDGPKDLNPNLTVSDARLCNNVEICAYNPSSFNIKFQGFRGTAEIKCKNDDKLSYIIDAYRKKIGYSEDTDRFYFNNNELTLYEMNKVLIEVGLQDNSIINVRVLGELSVIFRISGEHNSFFEIICQNSEKVSDMILRYRNKTGDYDKNKIFIFNAKRLNPNLCLFEAGICNNANIFVVRTK